MTPVFLSAVVYPGAGQFIQRRWVAGSVYSLTFSAALIWFVTRTLQVLSAYYEFAFNFATATGKAPSSRAIIVSFVVCLILYVANVVDAAVGGRLARQKDPSS
jgi:hypothetical protein